MRKFQLTILDRDGEEHSYAFQALNAWGVLRHVSHAMISEGDFYGQTDADSVNVTLTEMIPTWDGDGQHFIALGGK